MLVHTFIDIHLYYMFLFQCGHTCHSLFVWGAWFIQFINDPIKNLRGIFITTSSYVPFHLVLGVWQGCRGVLPSPLTHSVPI